MKLGGPPRASLRQSSDCTTPVGPLANLISSLFHHGWLVTQTYSPSLYLQFLYDLGCLRKSLIRHQYLAIGFRGCMLHPIGPRLGSPRVKSAEWTPPSSPLFRIKSSLTGRSTHLLQRVFNVVLCQLPALLSQGCLDLLSKSHNSLWVSCSFFFYTPPLHLLVSGSSSMLHILIMYLIQWDGLFQLQGPTDCQELLVFDYIHA